MPDQTRPKQTSFPTGNSAITWWSWRPGIKPRNAFIIGAPLTLLACFFIGVGLYTLLFGIIDSYSPPLTNSRACNRLHHRRHRWPAPPDHSPGPVRQPNHHFTGHFSGNPSGYSYRRSHSARLFTAPALPLRPGTRGPTLQPAGQQRAGQSLRLIRPTHRRKPSMARST